MARSLKVNQKFISDVKLAVQRNGYSRQDLSKKLGITFSTIIRFLIGSDVDQDDFIKICNKLGLNWQEIVDTEEVTPRLSYVLHLSDLHFGTTDNARTWYTALAEDLRYELHCSRLDALIISGDIATRAAPDEYAAAQLFINRLSQEFQLEPHQILIVPGNHDVNWEISTAAKTEAEHKRRFTNFSRFYEAIKKEVYPLEYEQQYSLQHLPEQNLLILGLNSAWQIDHQKKYNISINSDALTNALSLIRRNPDYESCLKIAVWHHSLNSTFGDRITESVMERLFDADFLLILHGSVHRDDNSYHYKGGVNGKLINIIGRGNAP